MKIYTLKFTHHFIGHCLYSQIPLVLILKIYNNFTHLFTIQDKRPLANHDHYWFLTVTSLFVKSNGISNLRMQLAFQILGIELKFNRIDPAS